MECHDRSACTEADELLGPVRRERELRNNAFQLSFNRFLRVGFQGSRVTSNGGLILVRELDERLGFSELIDEHLTDSRANNARFSFADLLRQSVYSRLAGTVKLSRICPFRGRILLDQRLRINDLAVAAGGENACQTA